MKYVKFGKTGLDVSRFGLGCMRFPTMKDSEGKDVIDEKAAIQLVRYAIDNGVNYIDTAYAYTGSEEVLGKALQDGYREKVILVTKLPVWEVKCKEDFRKFLDLQLSRLQTDYIDFYHLHNLFSDNWEIVKKYDAIKIMEEFKAEGKIKYIACSVHERLEHWKEVADAYDWDMMMMQYNYFDKYNQAGIEGLHYVAAKGTPVVIMESLRGGMLACEPPETVAKALAPVSGGSYAEKAFKWLIDQPECAVILSGCSSLEQVVENIKIFNSLDANCLTEAEKECYENAREEWNKKTLVPCTACGYCMPCPSGVDIPEVFEIYNNTARVLQAHQGQTWLYNQVLVRSKNDASQCIECGQCLKKCPQSIDIICKLKEAHEKLNS